MPFLVNCVSGKMMSENVAINRQQKLAKPKNDWMSRRFFGTGHLAIAAVFSTSMATPAGETMNPRNSTQSEWNRHFSGLIKRLYFWRCSSTIQTCFWCSSLFFKKMRMSSRYTMTNRSAMSRNMSFMKCWKVAGMLVNPKGMTRYSKDPYWVWKAVFHS